MKKKWGDNLMKKFYSEVMGKHHLRERGLVKIPRDSSCMTVL